MAKEKTADDKLKDNDPRDELEFIIREATASVEADLALEDAGWINLSGISTDVIPSAERINNIKLSRLYSVKDPLGKQAIRLWTDYSFGPGMTWTAEDDKTRTVLEAFWDSLANKRILGAAGQRKSSDKLLKDGMVYFAIFLGAGGKATIRRIDPLEVIEIITDVDDKENEMFYRRQWTDAAGGPHTAIYRSTTNIKNDAAKDAAGQTVKKSDDALVYRLEYNDGNPLLLPALDWIKYYRRFLSSRIAIMLALARFAWHTKVKGGQTAVDAIKAKTDAQQIAAASNLLENLGSDTQPIKTESGAKNAYDDGRMIKLQVCSAVGWPEQYFGDIATGNLATAKTVELPVTKMCQSYQSVWNGAYQDIDKIVLAHNNVPPDKWYVDRVFPTIAPENYAEMATSIQQIIQSLPELAYSDDVIMQALLSIGVNDPAEVIEQLSQEAKGNPSVALVKLLREFRESISDNGHKVAK